jgi:hypothetical protein
MSYPNPGADDNHHSTQQQIIKSSVESFLQVGIRIAAIGSDNCNGKLPCVEERKRERERERERERTKDQSTNWIDMYK